MPHSAQRAETTDALSVGDLTELFPWARRLQGAWPGSPKEPLCFARRARGLGPPSAEPIERAVHYRLSAPAAHSSAATSKSYRFYPKVIIWVSSLIEHGEWSAQSGRVLPVGRTAERS